MSTKLYDGLILKGPSDDLFELVPQVAAAVRGAFNAACRALVAEELVGYLDDARWRKDKPDGDLVIFDVEESWKKQQKELGHHHTLNDPLRFSIVFGRSSKNNILAYPYYREPLYREAVESLGLFEDYHYQNSTDGPEELTESAWKQRAEEWDSITNRDGTFADLPGWELGRTGEPFMEIYRGSRGDGFDLNSYVSPEQRLKGLLQTAILDSYGPIPRESIFRAFAAANRLSRAFIGGARRLELADPERYPTGLDFRYADLPAPYAANPSVVEELRELLREEL